MYNFKLNKNNLKTWSWTGETTFQSAWYDWYHDWSDIIKTITFLVYYDCRYLRNKARMNGYLRTPKVSKCQIKRMACTHKLHTNMKVIYRAALFQQDSLYVIGFLDLMIHCRPQLISREVFYILFVFHLWLKYSMNIIKTIH